MGLIREGTFLSFTTGTLLCSWLALIFSLYTLLCSVPPFFSQKLDIRVMQSHFLAARPGPSSQWLLPLSALLCTIYSKNRCWAYLLTRRSGRNSIHSCLYRYLYPADPAPTDLYLALAGPSHLTTKASNISRAVCQAADPTLRLEGNHQSTFLKYTFIWDTHLHSALLLMWARHQIVELNRLQRLHPLRSINPIRRKQLIVTLPHLLMRIMIPISISPTPLPRIKRFWKGHSSWKSSHIFSCWTKTLNKIKKHFWIPSLNHDLPLPSSDG